jgi:hypothetical protein
MLPVVNCAHCPPRLRGVALSIIGTSVPSMPSAWIGKRERTPREGQPRTAAGGREPAFAPGSAHVEAPTPLTGVCYVT